MTYARAHCAATAVACLVFGGLAFGTASAQAPTNSAGPMVTVTTIDQRTLTGICSGDATSLQIGSETIAVADLLSLRVDPAVVDRPAKALYCVWLRSGSILPATKIDGVDKTASAPNRLVIELASGGTIEVPVSTVAAVRTRANDPQTFAADRVQPDENRDYLYVVKDGSPQRFGVTIESVRDGNVHFDLRGSSYEFPLRGDDSVAGIVFGANTGFAPDRVKAPRVQASLAGGELCFGKLLALGASLRLQLDEGAVLEVPSSRLVGLDVQSDKLAWLSSMQPKVEQTPAFDRVWPWTADRSPAGPGIVLGGVTYGRGLVLVPRTRLTFDLGGRFDVFEAVLGLDERGGPKAHAIFRVLTDGKLLFELTQSGTGAPPRLVHLQLARCRELTLEADFGDAFDLGDLCAFAEARVLQVTDAAKK
ncbi:MAG: NPCBM/NEW2 domain-containing protein [Planctomycetota bacterium]